MAMADMAVFPHPLLKKFIALYKEHTCLWDRRNPDYKIKHKRHEAMSKLTELLQQHFPRATRVHVLRKIESMRSCVRREYKKVLESRLRATKPEELYAPQLWYYDLCLFMFGEEGNNSQGRRTCDHQNAEESEEETSGYLEEDDEMPFERSIDSYPVEYKVSTSTSDAEDNPPSLKRYSLNDESTSSNKRHCTEIEDEYDAIATRPAIDHAHIAHLARSHRTESSHRAMNASYCINVAAKLRALPPNMRILAEKLVNDVLFQAQMNCLTSATIITTPDPFKQDI